MKKKIALLLTMAMGMTAEDRRAEVNIYGKSLHTEYIDSPLGINYIHPDKVETIEHNIIGLPQSIPELDCLQWLYYGKRDNETNTTPLLENIKKNVVSLQYRNEEMMPYIQLLNI